MGLIKLALIGGVAYFIINRSKECHRGADGRWNNRGYRGWPTNEQDAQQEPPPYYQSRWPRKTQPEKARTSQVPVEPQEDFYGKRDRLYIEQPQAMRNDYYAIYEDAPRYQHRFVEPNEVMDMGGIKTYRS